MSQQDHSEENLLPVQSPVIQQQVENSTLDGGMQAAIGDDNIQIQGDSNVITFNKTEILQISVTEIKTRKFIETSPYKGLKKFEPEDKDLFFGRDQFLTSLVNELEQTNLVLLLGASGSGKSSVVRAGLVPWLFQKYGTQLVNLTFTPDVDPFESLYASLLGKNTQSQAKIAREAKAGTLTQVVTRLKQADDYWFILIDQFEELFTTSQPEKRERFIASLVQLAKAKLPIVKIMVTMRADFLDKLSPYPALVKTTDKHRPLIAEMQLDELRLAIEQPAAHHGVVFETGLVEEIIKDVQGQAGYLPLLQYTLNLLWDTEVKNGSINNRTLNINTYRQLGGVRGALQQRVDNIYEDLSAQEKIATQRIFLKLVDIGGDEDSGTEWKPVRRRAPRFEFSDKLEQDVLAKLINNNLLVSDHALQSQQSTVEIAHETLLISWTTLNTWIKENRNSIALRNRLNDDVARWKVKKAQDELWGGSKLEKILELRKDETFNQVLGGFGETTNQFIDDSLGLRDQQLRRAKITAVIGLTLAALTSAATIFAFLNGQESQRQSIIALTKTSEAHFRSDNQLEAMVEAIRAGRQLNNLVIGRNDVSDQLKGTLQQVVYGIQERLRLKAPGMVEFSPNDQQLATWGKDGTVHLWDILGKQLAELRGHSSEISDVVFSPDGEQLATWGKDGIVGLWDTSGKLLAQWHGHSSEIIDVVFSPDGKQLATGGGDGIVRLWDTSGKLLAQWRGDSLSVQSVEFSPDGKQLATGGLDATVRLWDKSGKQLATMFGSVERIKFSPDSKRLVTLGRKDTARLWDASGKLLATMPDEIVYDAEFNPDGKQLATGGNDGIVRLWDVSGKLLVELRGHSSSIMSVKFSPDGKQLATGDLDGTVRLWDTSGYQLAELRGHIGSVWSVVFSPDAKHLTSAGYDDTVRLWDRSGKKLVELHGHSGDVSSVAFSPDGKQLATAGDDGTVRLWDTSGKQLVELHGHSGKVWSVVFSPDGKQLATAGNDGTVRLWDISGKQLVEVRGHSGKVWSVVFSPDGKQLATAGGDGTVRLWDTSGKQLVELHRHSGGFNSDSVVFSPDGKQLAIMGEKNATVQLWGTSGKQLAELPVGFFGKMAFSPDSKQLAIGGYNGIVGLWDNTSGKKLAELRGHSDRINGVIFSPDSKQLVTVGEYGTVLLWDNTSGNKLAELRGHSGSVESVAFSPDGKQLATAGEEGTVLLWQVGGIDELLIRSCSWVRSYLNFKPKDDPDRYLCDRIGNNK